MTVPVLEYDMLLEMEVYMTDLINEHVTEINQLVLIRQHYKKAGKLAKKEEIQQRIDKIKGYENKARNFILFIKDYLKTAYGKEE